MKPYGKNHFLCHLEIDLKKQTERKRNKTKEIKY